MERYEETVLATVRELHSDMGYVEPPFSTSKAIVKLFPEIRVVGKKLDRHAEIHVYRRPLPSGVQAKIFYAAQDHHSTQRFSIAHELGHWLFCCDRGKQIPDAFSCTPESRQMRERRANFFASEFLVPLVVLDRFVTFEINPPRDDEDAIGARDQEIQRIASWFNVSMLCARWRVQALERWRRKRP